MLRADDVDGVCSVNDGGDFNDANHDGVVDDGGGDVVADLHLQDLVCTEP